MDGALGVRTALARVLPSERLALARSRDVAHVDGAAEAHVVHLVGVVGAARPSYIMVPHISLQRSKCVIVWFGASAGVLGRSHVMGVRQRRSQPSARATSTPSSLAASRTFSWYAGGT